MNQFLDAVRAVDRLLAWATDGHGRCRVCGSTGMVHTTACPAVACRLALNGWVDRVRAAPADTQALIDSAVSLARDAWTAEREQAIQAAVLAERQRCAGVRTMPPSNRPDQTAPGPYADGWRNAQASLSRAILAGPEAERGEIRAEKPGEE